MTDPLPDATFDLIHARLVLSIIPEPEKVLVRLVAALKPGGVIVEEEFDSQSLDCDPLLMTGEVHLKTQTAFFRRLRNGALKGGGAGSSMAECEPWGSWMCGQRRSFDVSWRIPG